MNLQRRKKMTQFTIEITYKTGNSFNTYTDTDTVDVVWSDLSKAKIALQYIKLHEEAMNDFRSAWTNKEKKELKDKLSLQPWFKNTNDDYYYYILVPDDSDNPVPMYAFWMGYFEQINSAKIVTVNKDDDDMEIHF